MNAVVMGILDALIGFFMRMLASFLEFFTESFLTSVEWDFETFGDYIPFFGNVLSFFKVFAASWLVTVGLLFVLKCFGLAAGLQINRSKIWQFVLRYLFFGYLAVQGWGIMSFFYLELVKTIDDVMVLDATTGGGFINGILDIGSRVGEGFLLAAAGPSGAIVGVAKVLVLLVITFMLVTNFFKLISLFFLRYIRLVFLVALAPVAFGMAILEETKQIFDTYIRTFFADMFVFIMTAFFIKGFISVLYSAGTFEFDDFDDLFADAAYNDLVWAFFALAYSNFAVQFDQFIASLGVNISRGGSTGGSIMGAIGASAMMLRRAIGTGRGSAGLSTPFGSTFSKNWNSLKGSVLSGARGGFASGQTKAGAFAGGVVGAAKGFAGTTNVAKAAAMTKDGSSFAEALNQKFNDRFAEMKDAAGRNMSQSEYDAMKQRAQENGLDLDKQQQRDKVMKDLADHNITNPVAQAKMERDGLLNKDEKDALAHSAANRKGGYEQNGQIYTQPYNMAGESVNRNGAEGHKQFDFPDNQQDIVEMSDGTKLTPNNQGIVKDGMSYHPDSGYTFSNNFKDAKGNPAATTLNGSKVDFGNGSYMDSARKTDSGTNFPPGTMFHTDPNGNETITCGNQILNSNGEKIGEIDKATNFGDEKNPTTVYPDGGVNIGGPLKDGGISIGEDGTIKHGKTGAEFNSQTGLIQQASGLVHHPSGATTDVNGNTFALNGAVVSPDGGVKLPNGDIIDTTAGETMHGDTSITTPNAVLHSDKSRTIQSDESTGEVHWGDGFAVRTGENGNGAYSEDGGKTWQPIPETGMSYNGAKIDRNATVEHPTGEISNPFNREAGVQMPGCVAHYNIDANGGKELICTSSANGYVDYEKSDMCVDKGGKTVIFTKSDGNEYMKVSGRKVIHSNGKEEYFTYRDNVGDTTVYPPGYEEKDSRFSSPFTIKPLFSSKHDVEKEKLNRKFGGNRKRT